MKEPKRYYCGNGEGMFEDDKSGHWVEYSEHKAIVESLTEQFRKHTVGHSYIMMSKYRVQTGSLDVTVEAKNHRMAAIKAIDENNPKSLGLIVSILKEGDSLDDELFMKSEFILECMGFKLSE